MVAQSLTIALIVLSIHYTLQPGEIFARVGKWFADHLPPNVHPAVFECNVCMSWWYGTALYWLIYGYNWQSWLIVVIVAMGFNIVINKWSHDD